MNILLLHSDKLEYETKKATKLAEKIPDKLKQQKVKDSLVCFMSFEEDDNGKEKAVAANLVKEIIGVAEQVKEKQIVLYPYVHLLFGKKPSRPETALEIAGRSRKTGGCPLCRTSACGCAQGPGRRRIQCIPRGRIRHSGGHWDEPSRRQVSLSTRCRSTGGTPFRYKRGSR